MGTHRYRLTVEGELGGTMASAFPGMSVTPGHGNTTITGEIHDQAEMQGLLRRVTDLGLTLLESKVVDPEFSGPEPSAPRLEAGE